MYVYGKTVQERSNLKPWHTKLIDFLFPFPFSEPSGTVLPRLIEPPEERRKIEKIKWVGDNVLLPCVAQGLPVPEST